MTQRPKFSRARLIVASLALVGSIAASTACNSGDEEAALRRAIVANCEYDINEFILDKLQNNRVVMLADSWHGHPLPRETLTDFLNYWLDLLDQADRFDVSIPAKLFLVVETDSSGIERFNSYARTLDATDLFRHLKISFAVNGPQFSVEEVEYNYDLVAIQKRVADHNARATNSSSLDKYIAGDAPRNRQIAFEIIGPERPIDLNDWSYSRRDSFFIWERDEYSSGRVIDLLEQHPDFDALVFYGSAHFNRDLAHKNTSESPTHPGLQGDGYFLAHYLTERFDGEGGVYTIGQSWITQSNRVALFAPARSYALDNSILENAEVDLSQLPMLLGVDGNIVHFEKVENPTPIVNTWSAHLVDVMIPTLPEVTDMTNDFVRAIHSAIYRYLETYTGLISTRSERDFRDSTVVPRLRSKWSNWRRGANLDVVADLDTCGPALRSIGLLDKSDSLHEQNCRYYATAVLGRYAPPVDSSYSVKEVATLCREYLGANKDAIVIENLVSLLWVGTAEEQAGAKAVLQRILAATAAGVG